jgi:hypothetical protein
MKFLLKFQNNPVTSPSIIINPNEIGRTDFKKSAGWMKCIFFG